MAKRKLTMNTPFYKMYRYDCSDGQYLLREVPPNGRIRTALSATALGLAAGFMIVFLIETVLV